MKYQFASDWSIGGYQGTVYNPAVSSTAEASLSEFFSPSILEFIASSDNSDQDFDRIVGSLPFDFEPRLTLPLPRPLPAPPSTPPLQKRIASPFILL